MGDYLDSAREATEARKRETLNALATAGTGGVDALEAARGEVRAAQDAALDQAMRTAAQRGAPAGAQAEIERLIREPGDRAVQALAANKGAFLADMSRRAGRTEDYMAQAQAAVPVIRAAADRDIAMQKAVWEDQQRRETEKAAKWQQEAIAGGLAEMTTETDLKARAESLAMELVEKSKYQGEARKQAHATTPLIRGRDAGSQRRLLESEGLDRPEVQFAGTPAGDRNAEIVASKPMLRQQQLNRETESFQGRQQQVAGQREAWSSVFGDETQESEAMARGMFPMPSEADVADDTTERSRVAFVDQFGVEPSPTQVQKFARGEDPFAKEQEYPRAIQRPEEAGARLGLQPKDVEAIVAVPAWGDAVATAEAYLEDEGYIPRGDFMADLEAAYGEEASEVIALVLEVYGSKVR